MRIARAAALACALALGCGARPGAPATATQHARAPAPVTGATAADGPALPAEHPASPLAPSRPSAPRERHVILVTVDGVRWQDVFEGASASLAPRPLDELARPEGLLSRTWDLVGRSGVALGHGDGCGPVRPRNTTHISLPGYLEIFTGRRTTCMSNVCPPVDVPTVLDAAAAAGLRVASLSSWEMLDRAVSANPAQAGVFVSAGTRWPGPRPLEDARLEAVVEQGEQAKPFPAPGGTYRPDKHTMAIAVAYFRARRPRLLHVGLGDTDEHAHRDDYLAYLGAIRETDVFLGDLADELDAAGLFESSAVVVVSDHGRAASPFREHGPSWPESGRSFLLAFGGLVRPQGETCAVDDLWLTDVAPTVKSLLALPLSPEPDVIGRPIRELAPRPAR